MPQAQRKHSNQALEALRTLIDDYAAKEGTTREQILSEIAEEKTIWEIPVTALNPESSPLQGIVSYLRHEKELPATIVAQLLARDVSTVNQASTKKRASHPSNQNTPYTIPLIALREGNLSILEASTTHLHEHYKLTFSAIARLTGRDPRTIWTAYHRAQKKRANPGASTRRRNGNE